MTLIITVESKNHVVLTADGRSKGKIDSNILQKIFPHPKKGFAIVHHGQNLIEERRVEEIVNEFLSNEKNTIRKSSVQQIARLFVQKYGESIRKTLEKIQNSKRCCGFLFVGFGIAVNRPKIYEACWEKDHLNNIIPKKHRDLVLSGDAKDYILKYLDNDIEKQFRQNNILKGTVQEAKAYGDKLYRLAEEEQTKAGEDIFGGHKHQLVIRKSGWEWLISPKQVNLTLYDR